jgi:hypothetical protein
MSLQVEDFLTAGIGCDLGSAYLLSRGLIKSPAALTRLSGGGSNRYQVVAAARDRLDGWAGIVSLGFGFLLQAVAYLAQLDRSHHTSTGTVDLLIGAATMVVGLALVLIGGYILRKLRLVAGLVEMARHTLDGERLAYPSAVLVGWLEAAGLARKEGETDLAYVRRTAGVEDLTDVSS